jgi:biopolymer transport protein ExbD
VARYLAETPEGSVIIVADKSSRTGTVIRVLDEGRLAGAKDISIAAKKPEP